jgi:hypothetical protein
MKVQEWPNHQGYTIKTEKGDWDFGRGAGQRWVVNHFNSGAMLPNKSGQGATPAEALLQAVKGERGEAYSFSETSEELLAGALEYESRYGHGSATAIVAFLAALERLEQ